MSMELSPADAPGRIQNPLTRQDKVVGWVATALEAGRRQAITDADHGPHSWGSPHETPPLPDELVHALGLPWTRHNPVWGPMALDKLRALQHTLMKKSFSLAQDERGPTLLAVKTLETAVGLRLRFEEARHSEQNAVQTVGQESRGVQPADTARTRAA